MSEYVCSDCNSEEKLTIVKMSISQNRDYGIVTISSELKFHTQNIEIGVREKVLQETAAELRLSAMRQMHVLEGEDE